MSRYSHPSRTRLSMTQQNVQDDKTKTGTMYGNDSDEDENVIDPPKLSKFGSALLNEHNSTTFTKFQHFRHGYNHTHTSNGTKFPTNNKIRRTVSELDESINQEISSPTSSSSIFANTINQTSIRPTSMTTLQSNHTGSSHLNSGMDTLQRMKQSMMRDETALSEKILERRNNRRISRTSSNHSTMNLDLSNAKEIELSGTISTINNNNPMTTTNTSESFRRIKTLQQNLKAEVTSKNIERRSKLFLNKKRMSRLGPAKRASEIIGSEIDDALVNSEKTNDQVDITNESKQTIDYSNIDLGDLNPFQYIKKHNLPATELPQISEIYFKNQKEGNRANAIRKRSLTPVIARKKFSNNDNINRDIRRSKTESNTALNNKENVGLSTIDHNVDRLPKKREALTNIQVNKKEPEFKRMKSDPEQLNQMVVQEEVKIGHDSHKTKPVKKVEIQEPTASKRYHRHETVQDSNRNPIILVNDTEYEKIELLGRGGSSKVYKVKGPSKKVYALKRVSFDEFDDSSIDGFKGEIALLEKLRNKDRVVQLFDYEMSSGVLYLIMECGDYDLSFILNQKLKVPIDIEFIRYYAREMIKCVNVVHDADIVHSDLKPANFVFVKGMLKIIDFGIANAVPDHTVNIYRETQIGTPNYMAPEALVAMNYTNDNSGQTGNRWKVGKPSDVWSIGCIIYQMVYGKPPYAGFQGQNRLLAIMNPEVKIMYPDKTSKDEVVPRSVIDLMKDCLHRDPNKRLTTNEMLQTQFFNPIMVSESFIRNLIKNAVYFGCEQGEVSDGKIDDLADDVISRLGEFKI